MFNLTLSYIYSNREAKMGIYIILSGIRSRLHERNSSIDLVGVRVGAFALEIIRCIFGYGINDVQSRAGILIRLPQLSLPITSV